MPHAKEAGEKVTESETSLVAENGEMRGEENLLQHTSFKMVDWKDGFVVGSTCRPELSPLHPGQETHHQLQLQLQRIWSPF